MTDRTMKFLLALLVIGVWGLLLRPLFTAAPAQAQAGARSSIPTVLSKTETAGETVFVFLSRGGSLSIKAYRVDTRGGSGPLNLRESNERRLLP